MSLENSNRDNVSLSGEPIPFQVRETVLDPAHDISLNLSLFVLCYEERLGRLMQPFLEEGIRVLLGKGGPIYRDDISQIAWQAPTNAIAADLSQEYVQQSTLLTPKEVRKSPIYRP